MERIIGLFNRINQLQDKKATLRVEPDESTIVVSSRVDLSTTPVGTTLEDLKGELGLIMAALDKEIIDIGDEENGIGQPK